MFPLSEKRGEQGIFIILKKLFIIKKSKIQNPIEGRMKYAISNEIKYADTLSRDRELLIAALSGLCSIK
jgi:hypothetical protein